MSIELEARPERSVGMYDLPEEEMVRRANLLLERMPVENGLVCFELDDTKKQDALFEDVARTLEARAFKKFENTPEDMVRLYGQHDKAADNLFFHDLYVENGLASPAGTLRMVRNRENGLPTINGLAAKKKIEPSLYGDFLYEFYGIGDPSKCWDIATAAVAPEYRGTQASGLVYRAGLLAAKKAGIEHFFAIIDKEAFKGMEILGFPFKPLPGESWQEFEGSPSSLPVYGRVADFEPAIQARQEEWIRAGKRGIAERFPFDIIGRGTSDNLILLS
ncbi:hypothetical protein PV379_04800 [Streptomyces caniscabiei]|uniref:hypothetical protein n=1 Tax=Streptomyces caniscabiei TaxID=2746961 RepID=UPI0029A2D84F|nr:hypothetical protein [Streptomyces caniscabiei]MDX2776649.1 hypothetical protein [Streptomyces caniscabiei]